MNGSRISSVPASGRLRGEDLYCKRTERISGRPRDASSVRGRTEKTPGRVSDETSNCFNGGEGQPP